MSDTDHEAAVKRGQAKADQQTETKAAKAKGKGDGKGKDSKKKKGKGKGKSSPSDGPSVAGHPRAAAQVRRAKGLGGVGGFALAAYLGSKAGIAPDQIVERALAAGVAGYILAWACAVAVWRHLVLAELRALADRTLAAAEAQRAPTVSLQAGNDSPPVTEPAT